MVGWPNIRLMHFLEQIAKRFVGASVNLMVLKGAALNLTVYDRPDQRPMSDLDLMVRPDHFDRALGVMRQAGCQRSQVLVRKDFSPSSITRQSLRPVMCSRW